MMMKKEEIITVVMKLPDEKVEVRKIKNTYKELSEFCEGLIDIASSPIDGVDIIFNDEFLMNGMRPNIVTPENYGVICGPIIFAGVDSQTGDTISLTEEQVKKVIQYCNDNMLFNMALESAYAYSRSVGSFNKYMREMMEGKE